MNITNELEIATLVRKRFFNLISVQVNVHSVKNEVDVMLSFTETPCRLHYYNNRLVYVVGYISSRQFEITKNLFKEVNKNV